MFPIEAVVVAAAAAGEGPPGGCGGGSMRRAKGWMRPAAQRRPEASSTRCQWEASSSEGSDAMVLICARGGHRRRDGRAHVGRIAVFVMGLAMQQHIRKYSRSRTATATVMGAPKNVQQPGLVSAS